MQLAHDHHGSDVYHTMQCYTLFGFGEGESGKNIGHGEGSFTTDHAICVISYWWCFETDPLYMSSGFRDYFCPHNNGITDLSVSLNVRGGGQWRAEGSEVEWAWRLGMEVSQRNPGEEPHWGLEAKPQQPALPDTVQCIHTQISGYANAQAPYTKTTRLNSTAK